MTQSKKLILGFVFLLVVCMSGVVLADGFSVRNGISFGMSPDEVMKIEKDNGSSPEYSDYGFQTVMCKNVNIAGIDNATIVYRFANKKLTSFNYSWVKKWYKKEDKYNKSDFQKGNIDSVVALMKNDYEKLNGALSKKYNPIGSLVGKNKIEYVNFNSDDKVNLITYSPNPKIFKAFEVYNFNQYLTPVDNGYVEVVANFYRTESLFTETKIKMSNETDVISLPFTIYYRYISEHLYNQKLEEAQTLQQKIDDDL